MTIESGAVVGRGVVARAVQDGLEVSVGLDGARVGERDADGKQ